MDERERLQKLRSNFGYVQFRIDEEGFDYAFRQYSDFEEVQDPQFHLLRLVYKQTADALELYVKEKAKTDPIPEGV